jgi:redox-sensitive bicupin YhaK (pirin superfamily)
MKTILHKAATRGSANHGWLNSRHTFSFAGYFNPERQHFGALRVLNDDIVAGGAGFGEHPHDNMEIISIPLKGALEHKDSTGTKAIIKENDVQIMSAGTGIRHAEYNASPVDPVNFLQIWVFPKEKNIAPRYDQKTFDPEKRINKMQLVVSPDKGAETIWINQDAYFSLGRLEAEKEIVYPLYNNRNGLYVFVLEGEMIVANNDLNKRDGLAITEIQSLTFKAKTNCEVLLIEVPLTA